MNRNRFIPYFLTPLWIKPWKASFSEWGPRSTAGCKVEKLAGSGKISTRILQSKMSLCWKFDCYRFLKGEISSKHEQYRTKDPTRFTDRHLTRNLNYSQNCERPTALADREIAFAYSRHFFIQQWEDYFVQNSKPVLHIFWQITNYPYIKYPNTYAWGFLANLVGHERCKRGSRVHVWVWIPEIGDFLHLDHFQVCHICQTRIRNPSLFKHLNFGRHLVMQSNHRLHSF